MARRRYGLPHEHKKRNGSVVRSGASCLPAKDIWCSPYPLGLRASSSQQQQYVFCSTKPSWQGGRCAPPLHPPGRGSVRALNPSRAIRTYRRSITRGRLRSPCTHRHGGVPSPKTPAHSMEATSWRRFHRDQPSADWMPIRSFVTRYPRQFH